MRGLLLIVPVFLMIFCCESLYCQEKAGVKTVVIDAGHGGKDPGAMGKKSQEKKITLSLALKLGKLIKERYPDVRVIFTRDKDYFVELHERANIANRNKADLFISIHCNANRSAIHHGAETYVMGLHKTEANLSIAKMENASILMEPDYQVNYQGFDPNSDESYITFTLFQNIFLEQSTLFASMIQESLTAKSSLGDRGVRQAGFMVLYKTTMPSVLVEAGFLSNSDEEKFLISEAGQEQVAASIFRAFKAFKAKMDGVAADTEADDSSMKAVEAPVKDKNPATKPLPVKKDTVKVPEKNGKKNNNEVTFRVQFAMYPNDIPINSSKFRGLEKVKMYRHKGMYKYTTGEDKDIESSLNYLEVIKKKGYKDAFVVAFQGNTRITVEEAKKLLSADFPK